jgi:hypothetical protein
MDKEFFFPSRNLKPEHLKGPTVLTIARLEAMDFYDQKSKEQKPKPVLVFTDKQYKPMILNITNWEMLELLYSADTDCWKEQRVVVHVEKVHSPKGMVDALRITQEMPAKSNRETWGAFRQEYQLNDDEIEAIFGVSRISDWLEETGLPLDDAMDMVLQARAQQDSSQVKEELPA